MMIFPDGGTVAADYSDGTHVIHYVAASIEPGRSVTFTSRAQAGVPTFRLRYDLKDARTLAVAFQMAPPGSVDYRPIATGTLTKAE